MLNRNQQTDCAPVHIHTRSASVMYLLLLLLGICTIPFTLSETTPDINITDTTVGLNSTEIAFTSDAPSTTPLLTSGSTSSAAEFQFGSRSFSVFTAAANWTDSEQNCVTWGGHLASVHSSEEYTFIRDLVLNATGSNSYTWLGGTDSAQEGVWVWTDGSVFNYSTWASGQPDNYLNIENCLVMNWGADWNDGTCFSLLPSVCAKCQNGWTQFGSRCFRIFTARVSWNVSEQNCVAMGGHLASVHSSAEYIFIKNLVLNATGIPNSYAWLGGSDIEQEGVWMWTDGSVFNYSSWAPGQPDNNLNRDNCLIMNYQGNWNDGVCNSTYPSVCANTFYSTAVPSTAVPSTTVPSTTVPSTAILLTAVPSTTVPSTTVPSTTVPSTTVPSTTVPSTAILLTAVPSTTVPSTTVPSTTVPSTTVPSTTVPSPVINGTSGPTSRENVLVMRLKVISVKDLMASNSSQLFLQQLKGLLIDRGLPNNFTLRLRSVIKKSP